MFRKNYFTPILTIALFLIGSVAAFAQTGAPVAGQVLLKDGDKLTPVANAVVEVYRVDINAKFPSAKTDKKGYFAFAALPFGATFALSISGPGIGPEIIPNVKAGMDKLVIHVLAGDGKKWTEEEVRQGLANSTSNSNSTELSEDQKKEQAEFEKKKAEIDAKNKKIESTNKLIDTAVAEGDKALDANNYDLAIAKYEEGYQAAPEFMGSAPIFLNKKGAALIARGVSVYNNSTKADNETKAAARESAKKDFEEAINLSEKVIEMMKNATTTDPNTQKSYNNSKYSALLNRKNAFRLLAQTGGDRERGKEALVAFQDYMAVETEPAKKSKAQMDLALTLQDSNEFDLAIVEFEKILAEQPDNPDALVGIGLSLVNIGYVNLDTDPSKGKQQLQEAANYLQKFVDIAPDTHKFKKDAIDTIASLKEQQKVTPQKVTTKSSTKKKN